MPALPALVAHRGYARHYPENTLAAVRGAIEVGARHVEIDVQLTRDRTPVLFHDRTLGRLCEAPGAVHDHTDAALGELRAAVRGTFGERFADEPIAPLAAFAELLARYPEVEAFIELKRIAIERFGSEVVLERTLEALEPIRHRCVLISFSIEVLTHARSVCSLPLGPVIESWKDLTRPDVHALAPDCVFAAERILPRRGPLGLDGPRLCVYEIDDPARALELAARGVDMIETFAIGEMLTAFGEREGSP